jgi:formate/nitrite transporter FocA (FNT family)
MERAERTVTMFIGAIFGNLHIALWILAFFGNLAGGLVAASRKRPATTANAHWPTSSVPSFPYDRLTRKR